MFPNLKSATLPLIAWPCSCWTFSFKVIVWSEWTLSEERSTYFISSIQRASILDKASLLCCVQTSDCLLQWPFAQAHVYSLVLCVCVHTHIGIVSYARYAFWISPASWRVLLLSSKYREPCCMCHMYCFGGWLTWKWLEISDVSNYRCKKKKKIHVVIIHLSWVTTPTVLCLFPLGM